MNNSTNINPIQATRYNEYLVDLYKDKKLGYDACDSRREKYTTLEFSNINQLLEFLSDSFVTSERGITAAGKAFMKYYWGWDRLAEILVISAENDRNCSIAGMSEDEFSKLSHWESIAAIANGLRDLKLPPDTDPASQPDASHDDKAQLDY